MTAFVLLLRAVGAQAVAHGKHPTEGAQTRLLTPAVWLAWTRDCTRAFDEAADRGEEEVDERGANNEASHPENGTNSRDATSTPQTFPVAS